MKKYWGISLVFSLALFFGIPISYGYYSFLIANPNNIDVSLGVMQMTDIDLTVSIDKSFAYLIEGDIPYGFYKSPICNEYDDRGNCVEGEYSLCPYIKLTPKSGEPEEIAHKSIGVGGTDSFIAEGLLSTPAPSDGPWDEKDEWVITVVSPCFQGKCPGPFDYDNEIYGDVLPQEIKGKTLGCYVTATATDPPSLIKTPGVKSAYADWTTGRIKVTATFTGAGEVEAVSFDPVVIIPGILGSAEKNGKWVIDPIFHVYDNLIETLKQNGYEEGKTLFTFPYEWRDSNKVNALLLREKLFDIEEICDCSQIDIVAHSMGGLIAREYVQSPLYERNVDRLIFLGTPHLGAPKAYLTWEGGESAGDLFDSIIKFLFSKESSKNGYNNIYTYVRSKVDSIEELLPTYNYLKINQPGTLLDYPNNYPRNYFLENLENTSSALFNSRVRVVNIFGNTSSSTINFIRVASSTDPVLWEHGVPDGFYSKDSVDKGLELGIGDGTVPVYSANPPGVFQDNIIFNSGHTKLPTNTEGVVCALLTGYTTSKLVDDFKVPSTLMILKMLSPADFQIVTPDGKRIGKNFQSGQEINEIDGAFYSGFLTDNEYITIPDPSDGEYKIITEGTGFGGSYTVAINHITESSSTEADFTGQILPGVIEELNLNLNATDPDPIYIRLEDSTAPNIIVVSPQAKDYFRSEKITVSATSTDAESGVFHFVLSLDGKQEISDGQTLDLFYQKLGKHEFIASSTDFMLNATSTLINFRIIANPESVISDIDRAYSLGWIKKKQVKDSLIRQIKAMIRLEKRFDKIEERLPNGTKKIKKVERVEQKIDKILGKLFNKELQVFFKSGSINQQAFNLLEEDINWLLANY